MKQHTRNQPDRQIFDTRAAADYLGIDLQTVRWHVNVKGDLAPDKRIGGRFMVFTRETLDAYQEGRKPDPNLPPLYSTKEAAEYLGMTVDGIAYHIHREDNLEPDLRVAGRLVFTQETLDAFKRSS